MQPCHKVTQALSYRLFPHQFGSMKDAFCITSLIWFHLSDSGTPNIINTFPKTQLYLNCSYLNIYFSNS
jgi:hypothetical protein